MAVCAVATPAGAFLAEQGHGDRYRPLQIVTGSWLTFA